MSAAPEGLCTYGVHDWVDEYGNHGTEVRSPRDIKVQAVRSYGLFEPGNENSNKGLVNYFSPGDNSKRKIFVVIDSLLPEIKRTQIENYLIWCKTENLLEDYVIEPLAAGQMEKTLGNVLLVVTAAKKFGIRRRDLFVAIGSKPVTDIVGFAAAIYRRSTPYISVPTDLVGMVYCHAGDSKLAINHTYDNNHTDGMHRGIFSLHHLPIASFYDPSFLHDNDLKHGLAEIVKLAVIKDAALFSRVEAYLDRILVETQEREYLMTIIELTARSAFKEPGRGHLSAARFGEEAVQAIQHIKGAGCDDGDAVAMGTALMSALSFVKGSLSNADLGRILNLLEKAGLPICDEGLKVDAMWEHMTGVVQGRGGDHAFMVPVVLGKAGYLSITVVPEDISAALNILRDHSSEKVFEPGTTISAVNGISTGDEAYEWTETEDIQYHVASVSDIFSKDNPTLIRKYCAGTTGEHKKKILVVVDDYVGNIAANINTYFKSNKSIIENFCVLPMHVSGKNKDIDSVLKMINAAIDLKMAQQDLFIAVGGGTLMDIVGFAASIYKGGIPYIRIPTTLVGVIDAGVGVKVGVNFHGHKNFIGAYYAPVACLNDPATFFHTLPKREFACGLAEAIKMAVIKSPRLFEVIERYHRDVEHNTYTQEVIQISIRTMLEELQPNLEEANLQRIVDFGHEFGHIVEALALQEIPHGECVAIGMAISTYLAHMKGIVSLADLERMLDLILNMGLPIYATDHDCCNPSILWAKIRTEGIEHKDGMLYLVVPETIGRACFIDKISEVDEKMVSTAVFNLKHYADQFKKKSSPLTTAAIIGASSDIGSQLAKYLVHNGLRVICSVRNASIPKFKARVDQNPPEMSVLIGNALDLDNLRLMIHEAGIIYNMVGIVTLNAKPNEFAKVVAMNGFSQGIIAHLIQQMGRDQDVKFVYPSTQRIHLISNNESVCKWVKDAAEEFSGRKDTLLAEQDISTALERFAEQFLTSHPLPAAFNVYEISKALGEYFVSSLAKHSLVRISGVYGPTFTRGFIHRAINPKPEGNLEAPEKRDFIYIDDVNELLWKAARAPAADNVTFDGASGESLDLKDVWQMVRELKGDHATVTFKEGVAQEEHNPNPALARKLLGRDFIPMRLGLRKTIDKHAQELKTFKKSKANRHLLQHLSKPLIVLDVGATYLRVGVVGSHGLLLHEPARILSPSKQEYPQDTLARLQERLIETLIHQIDVVRARHIDLTFEEVGISFGAVITRRGVIEDASILWGEPARDYDFKKAMLERLPGLQLTVLNDISAAAWRYKDEGRFCLITVSSGLSNKVFHPSLCTPDKLDLDAAAVGGEMGHVIVNPYAVDMLVQHAKSQATAYTKEFESSLLYTLAKGKIEDINARNLGIAVKAYDDFAVRLLEELDVPYCSCGNIADLCSYSSGRGALRQARRLAAKGTYDIPPRDITDKWLQGAIATGHPLALKVLQDSTYPLALRILQLAADIGLDKFIIVGGFAMKTGKEKYLQALQGHLVRFCYNSGYFSNWKEDKIRGLVRFGVDDDNDGLIGIGNFMKYLQTQYQVVEKAVGGDSLALVTRTIPRCGTREILAKVVFSGICTTDLQILRSERGLEPVVLGHEGVCQVVEVGKDVKGLGVGEMIVLNPNNPLDEHDKLGHTREGVFQQYVKFGQEFIDRKQVLTLGSSTVSATYTLVEPLSCVVAAMERIKDRIPGKNVLVVGAGLMGFLFVLMNVKYGAQNVFLANRSKDKLDFAVSKGIISEDKVFTIGECLSQQVDEASAGDGVDIVIIIVSMGQGARATQEAISYVNAGGCVYLFGGFRPGDNLTLDGGVKVDITSIRSLWKTERIQLAGKSVDISGHRGSEHKDLVMATNLIRDDFFSFGRLISHFVSLEVLPEVLGMLARDGKIHGIPARRVIVDMDARGKVIELAEELPLRHLHEAAGKQRDAVSTGNLFRDIGFEGSSTSLGWVHPPAWADIKATLETALQMKPLSSKQDFIFVGTGAWVFLVDVLKKVMPANQDITSHTLQSLDPQALVDLFSQIKDPSAAVCVGISKSGRTLETVMLMNALRERFDRAGLNYRQHFVWVTDKCKSVNDNGKSGEETIRASKEHDWKDVEMMPLTVKKSSDISALFCTPHCMLMFFILALILGKETKTVWHIYQEYLALKDGVVLPQAYSIASKNSEHLQVNVDEDIAPAMGDLVTQLMEQSLGSKDVDFNPRVRVSSRSASLAEGFEAVELPAMPSGTSEVVKVMLTMNALAVFVAMVAYHRRIVFVTHPKVDMYKRRAVELYKDQRCSDPPFQTITPDIIMRYLDKHPQTRFVDILIYASHVSASERQSLKSQLISCLASRSPSISIDVLPGEQWNHSRYQAAFQTQDTLYVVCVLPSYCSQVEGISRKTVHANTRMLEAIAQATYETLLPKALYFKAGVDK